MCINLKRSCFQCVKGNKFESDSQLHETKYVNDSRCFQCVKGNKFESDSQLPPFTRTKEKVVSNVSKVINLKAIHNQIRIFLTVFLSCFQCVKGNKFESDSQLIFNTNKRLFCCFQCVKGNKFESDSQHTQLPGYAFTVVSNVSKVINLKAIHNS